MEFKLLKDWEGFAEGAVIKVCGQSMLEKITPDIAIPYVEPEPEPEIVEEPVVEDEVIPESEIEVEPEPEAEVEVKEAPEPPAPVEKPKRKHSKKKQK